jgi:gamma-glutamyltranspeptidase/glutathione hydrolase/leukotriene-C4 hydrolase
MRMLWFGEGVKEAVDARRIFHQLYPMELEHDYGVLDVSTPLI